ncbi:hypothetical protein ACFQH8_00765 [Halomicroarcula sp. GCM10025710]
MVAAGSRRGTGEQTKAHAEDEQRRRAGREQVRHLHGRERRVAGQRPQMAEGPEREIREGDGKDGVGRLVDRFTVSGRPAGPRLPPGRVVPERPPERREEDDDTRGPQAHTQRSDPPGTEGASARPTTPAAESGSWTSGACGTASDRSKYDGTSA